MDGKIIVDTSFATTKIKAIRSAVAKAIQVRELALIVQKHSVLAITQGPTRAIKTGRLRDSINASVRGLTGYVKPQTNYAYFVHEGTKSMRPRPYMKAGLEAATPEMESVVTDKIKISINS